MAIGYRGRYQLSTLRVPQSPRLHRSYPPLPWRSDERERMACHAGPTCHCHFFWTQRNDEEIAVRCLALTFFEILERDRVTLIWTAGARVLVLDKHITIPTTLGLVQGIFFFVRKRSSGCALLYLESRTQARRDLVGMGAEEAQHQRGQLLPVPGVTVVGLCHDAQLVVADVRRELPGVLRRDDLVFGAVDRENPTHQYIRGVFLLRSTEGDSLSPAVFAYGTAGK